ncbi:MAG: type 1 glutamine amidotransferase [Desulfarculus sp.]|jgi:protease I|nr:MAG: type 1 glutamine amidotransferase [Desulfarculus sp.]
MELAGKKIAIMAADLFNDYEFVYPYYRLQEAGAQVQVVGSSAPTTFHSKLGLSATSEAAAGNVSADDYHGLVIPGGYAPDIMRRDEFMVKLVKDIFNQGKPVGAICHAGWMLVSAGVLTGKECTSFFAIKDDMINAGGLWRDAEVVVDGNLITSRKPDDLPAFMKAFIAAF